LKTSIIKTLNKKLPFLFWLVQVRLIAVSQANGFPGRFSRAEFDRLVGISIKSNPSKISARLDYGRAFYHKNDPSYLLILQDSLAQSNRRVVQSFD